MVVAVLALGWRFSSEKDIAANYSGWRISFVEYAIEMGQTTGTPI